MAQYDMASNVGGMDLICTMFLSIVSPSLKATIVEAFIHVAKGGNGARSFGNTIFLARDNLEVARNFFYFDFEY
jgi:hypothetical protein